MNAPSWIRSLNLWGVTKWYCFPFTSPGRGFRVVSINIWWIIEANVLKKYSVRETLNPKRSGNSRKRRWRRVLFPTPEGPERTSGRRHMGVKVTGVTTLLYYKFPSQLLIISSANIPSPNHGRITNHNGCSMLQCTSEPIIIHRFHSLTPHQPIDFDGEVNLFHFVLLRCVGKGAFGKVGLSSLEPYFTSFKSSRFGSSSTSKPASSMPSNTLTKLSAWRWELFQMLYRREGSWKRFVRSISLHFSDQTIFIQVDHPFIVNLRYAFQDDENCFFVIDLMLGGDLRC